ncbi:MAG TPA: cytochrome c [Burkholderiaceae bacterium]|nr:cytochrome c [Burkholderiaceae bacterium]
MARWRRAAWAVLGLVALVLALAALVAWLNRDTELPTADTPPIPDAVARGAYLARLGNCAGCHTARGGRPYAGGRGLVTPFGTVYAGNLTPDPLTGLGQWSADDFWRALHLGRSRDGRLLTPAFPYTEFTQVMRPDSDALFAYLRSLAPVVQPNRPHELRFPYNTQAAQAVWRALFFRPASFRPEPLRPAEWNRGAYLVRGLGHCAACHAPRNALGATQDPEALAGGHVPMQPWFAPALGLAGLPPRAQADLVALLKTGTWAGGTAIGPMAEVVFNSTQHWTETDLQAVALYLQDLPAAPAAGSAGAAPAEQMALGAQLYTRHCADCHGARGEGVPGAYPPLAGNPSVQQATPTNLIQVVLHGGFAPATAGNPRPYGMPPTPLQDAEIAALLSYVRQSWGGSAAAVSALDVVKLR